MLSNISTEWMSFWKKSKYTSIFLLLKVLNTDKYLYLVLYIFYIFSLLAKETTKDNNVLFFKHFKHLFVLQCQKPNRQLHVQSNSRNTRTRCEICSKLTIKTPERRQANYDFDRVANTRASMISIELLTLEQGVKYVQS